MSPIIIPIAPGGAGAVDMTQANTDVGDIDMDCAEILHESAVKTHEALVTEISANEESAANIVRHAGARKFNREDPLEAAAADKILKAIP